MYMYTSRKLITFDRHDFDGLLFKISRVNCTGSDFSLAKNFMNAIVPKRNRYIVDKHVLAYTNTYFSLFRFFDTRKCICVH